MEQKINPEIKKLLPLGMSHQMRFALVKYGGGIVQMSGSIAGNTFARNRFGNYVRSRTVPVNPQSSRQTTVRARLAFLSEEWNDSLTEAQRVAWRTYASNVNWLNKLGETIQLTGFNHFIRGNSALLQAGFAQVNDGPVVMSLPAADPLFAVALSEATGITITFDDSFDWVNEDSGAMAVSIGNPQQPSINFFNGPWRWSDNLDGSSTVPLTTPEGPNAVTAYTLLEGQLVWVKARILREDGRLSNFFTADKVLVAA